MNNFHNTIDYSMFFSQFFYESCVLIEKKAGIFFRYANFESDTNKCQEMTFNVLFLQGVRASTVDACEHHDPCQNGGICISTDGGPICECSYIDFDGSYCEQSKYLDFGPLKEGEFPFFVHGKKGFFWKHFRRLALAYHKRLCIWISVAAMAVVVL